MLCYHSGFCSNVVNIAIFTFIFLGVRKGAGTNFHYMYTEIIKSRSTFEDLRIAYTILYQLPKSFYGLGKSWQIGSTVRATFISLLFM